MNIIYAILAMIGFGSYPVFAKKLISKYGSFMTSFYSHLIAWIIVLAILLPGFSYTKPTMATTFLIIMQGFIGASAVAVMFLAYKSTKVSLAVSLINIYPLIVLLASVLIFNEKFTSLKILAALIIIFGSLILVNDFLNLPKIKKNSIYIISLAVLLLSLNVILMKPIVVELGGRASSIFVETVTVLGLLMLFNIFDKVKLPKRKDFASFLIPGAFLGLAVSTIFFSINKIGVGLTGAIVGASPLVSSIFGRIYLKEKLNKKEIIGILTIVLGLVLISI
ncbi:DMT family transporter [Candidatus Woesearchaeota archaeon]|nr:MAG: DMT family transporter [Candidatus Woesearchaeota archaeon]